MAKIRDVFPFVCCLGVAAGAAWAHQGVHNAAVKARMHNMKDIAAELRTMGDMAKGQTVFDAQVAQAAALSMSRYAAETPALFVERETDPKSEAKPMIWERFGDFTSKSRALEEVALDLSATISDSAALRQGVSDIAKACKACHAVYRE